MHIEITDNTTLKDIQQTFSDFYPYLTIEFFRKPHKKYEGSDIDDEVMPDQTVGELRRSKAPAFIDIQPHEKVADVERTFQTHFGLSVQVYKRDKDQWQQTIDMDNFTLKELNEFGRSSLDEYILSDDEEGFEEGEE
jgi:hypothetical protein